MPLDRLAKRSKEGVRAAGRLPLRVRHHRRLRRHLHGPRGHAGLAGQPRGHRRLDRDGDARRALRRPGDLRRLRQVAARHAHGRGPDRTCPSSSSTAAPSCPGRLRRPGPRHRERLRGGRAPTPPTPSTDEELSLIEHNACPTEGSCAGMFTANTMASVAEAIGMSLPGQRLAAGRRPPPRRLRLRLGAGRGRTARAGHPAPPDHDQGGLRERHRRGHGPRRVDQRRAAPPGHRPRGAGRAGARRLQPGGRPGARTWPTPSPTAGSTWSTSTGSAACRWSCASCSRPASSTATA